jgi:hypothetical protein
MGPSLGVAAIRIQVLIEGLPPVEVHGSPTIVPTGSSNRTHSDHQFEIEFLNSGVEAFSVTFG